MVCRIGSDYKYWFSFYNSKSIIYLHILSGQNWNQITSSLVCYKVNKYWSWTDFKGIINREVTVSKELCIQRNTDCVFRGIQTVYSEEWKLYSAEYIDHAIHKHVWRVGLCVLIGLHANTMFHYLIIFYYSKYKSGFHVNIGTGKIWWSRFTPFGSTLGQKLSHWSKNQCCIGVEWPYNGAELAHQN